ncbi:hypothetical protein BIW11_10898 [Tropilaelaps mercedesae]|uniref:Uncharacterized protein n=1 Tax=Tropilaelaps mercedesae TaxID=418985 RepID=A0A1V9XDH1_9ACAR|nr:hypothetical protein BIW11_10898 [Tropilaelaps mercedesae]
MTVDIRRYAAQTHVVSLSAEITTAPRRTAIQRRLANRRIELRPRLQDKARHGATGRPSDSHVCSGQYDYYRSRGGI